MPITITCVNTTDVPFTCCDGSTSNSHAFSGVIVDDGNKEQRFAGDIQISRKASSVLVFNDSGEFRDIPVSEVAAASTVNQLASIISACQTDGVGGGYTKEVFTGVTGSVTISATMPVDLDKLVVHVGGLIANRVDHYTVTGQTISFNEDPENEIVQVFVYS